MKQSNALSFCSVQDALRLKNVSPVIGTLKPIEGADGSMLERVAREIAKEERRADSIVLTAGFGLDRSFKFPVRLPVLIIPALQVMEAMHRLGLPVPRLIAYQATGFIAEANQFSPDEAFVCAERMQQYLHGYVDQVHPEISDHVEIQFGCEYSDELRNEIAAVTEQIRALAVRVLQIGNIMVQLASAEERHSNGSGRYYEYAAANAIYSGATAKYPFAASLPQPNAMMMPIGGRTERNFFTVTRALDRDAVGDEGFGKVVPMLTHTVALMPPYYPREADPLTPDAYSTTISARHAPKEVLSDLEALMADGGTPDVIREIFPE